MDADLILAIAHHLAIFAVVATLAMEVMIMKPGLAGAAVARLGRIDGAYGSAALLVLAIGFGRVFWGLKGSEYYFANWAFHAKLTAFILVGVLSIPPTLRILRWRKAAAASPAYVVPDAEIGFARRFLMAEMALLALVPVFAAMMARGYGL